MQTTDVARYAARVDELQHLVTAAEDALGDALISRADIGALETRRRDLAALRAALDEAGLVLRAAERVPRLDVAPPAAAVDEVGQRAQEHFDALRTAFSGQQQATVQQDAKLRLAVALVEAGMSTRRFANVKAAVHLARRHGLREDRVLLAATGQARLADAARSRGVVL